MDWRVDPRFASLVSGPVYWRDCSMFIRRQDYPPISYYFDDNKGQKKTIKMVN